MSSIEKTAAEPQGEEMKNQIMLLAAVTVLGLAAHAQETGVAPATPSVTASAPATAPAAPATDVKKAHVKKVEKKADKKKGEIKKEESKKDEVKKDS